MQVSMEPRAQGMNRGCQIEPGFVAICSGILSHVHGCTINRQWLVAELLVLRNCFRVRGIVDMAGPVADTTRSRMIRNGLQTDRPKQTACVKPE